ncbi:hypothetical protein MON38_11240 [Hymenobacter sp. DH14]|uniref:Uncharacterized protein n=1 Tax=Hymenobacter cyanobacteriorum TaxID=2926463 RepID=A0A9X1VG57_9BACT|nr:hypothetical protein [Hymenobacter cyanobacteriorum]MCI1187995.1 hypothetical protein [Hymenobacter cyanobacteriorum]
MFRTVFTLALSMFLLAEASAQTTPATAKKTTAKATARAAKKARKAAIKSTPKVAVLNDGWPPIEETTAVASTATAANDGWGAATTASSNRGEIDNANVYASPGMPVHIRTSNGMVPYSVRPPRKPAAATTQNTLGN